MKLFSRKPKMGLVEFCENFYDKNLLYPVIQGIDAGAIFLDSVRKSVTEADSNFGNIDPALFEAQIGALRFEEFGLAWLHQQRLDIWDAMEPYNRAISRSCTHGCTRETALSRGRMAFVDSTRMQMFSMWHDQGFDPNSVARAANRLCSESAWNDGVTRGYLMLTLCNRLGCEVNEDAQFRLIATIIGFYRGAREAIAEVRIES